MSSALGIERDAEGNRISQPYAEREIRDDYGGVHEFRHFLEDIFWGLSDNGLCLLQVDDGDREIGSPAEANRGNWEHWPEDSYKILARRV